jgi:hypothetical protein
MLSFSKTLREGFAEAKLTNSEEFKAAAEATVEERRNERRLERGFEAITGTFQNRKEIREGGKISKKNTRKPKARPTISAND